MVDAQLPQVPPFFLARVAEEFTVTAERCVRLLSNRPGPLQFAQTRDALHDLAALGLQVQRAARIFGGDYLPVREHVELDAAIRSAADAARPRATRNGGIITTELHKATMWLDPAVLELLLELAMHWATSIGRLVQVRVAFANDTLHPDLLFTVRELHDPQWREHIHGDTEFNDLHWLLIRLIAQSQMLDPQRILMEDSASLMLRFPAPVEEVSQAGLTLSESPQPELEHGAMAGGCHVLVVEPDSNLRYVIRQTLHDAGMHVEAFSSPRDAEDLSSHFLAEAIVSGVPHDDPDMTSLLGVLRQKNPAVRVIQLTDDDFLYIGEDNATEAARVGRASVRQALVQAILLAVGVFAPPTLAARR